MLPAGIHAIAIITLLAIVLLILWIIPVVMLLILIVSTILLLIQINHSIYIRLWRITGNMKTIVTEPVCVHYSPDLEELITRDNIAYRCASELETLCAWFGIRRCPRVSVYVLTPGDVCKMTGGYGGWAFLPASLVVVPLEVNYDFCRVLRHELTHLLSTQLGPLDPAFKGEGLAVFLEECDFRWLEASSRRWQPPPAEVPPISSMLHKSFFLTSRQTQKCYQAAGNFTAFLIHRFGWLAYCQFYRRAHRWNYDRAFKQSFGVTLESAEADWRSGT